MSKCKMHNAKFWYLLTQMILMVGVADTMILNFAFSFRIGFGSNPKIRRIPRWGMKNYGKHGEIRIDFLWL